MVTSSYPKFEGDATAPFIESIARGIAARGHDVSVVLPHHPDLARRNDEPVRFLPYSYAPLESWNLWGYAKSLEADHRVRRRVYLLAPLAALALRATVSAELKARRYDVLHAHWLVPNAGLIADIARSHSVPLVVSLHGSDVFLAERSALAALAGRFALGKAGAVTACSSDLLQRAFRLGARPERSRVVPYGVDPKAFHPGASADGVRKRFSVAEGEVLVLGIGRLVEKKGFRHLVEAATLSRGFRVLIAGDGDLRGELEALARAAPGRVLFAGELDRDGIARALQAADIVAIPSVVDRAGNVDGLPNTLLEALASGRTVVASRVGGIPEILEDGVNGLLVAPGDPKALAAALERLAADPEARRRLGAEARRTAETKLGWARACAAFEECYAQAAALDAR